VPNHHSEAKGDSRSRSSVEPAEAGLAHCFVPLSLHTRVCGNHPIAFVASASHSQASWPQLPPPPPLQPTYSRGQLEGRQYPLQQREVREESKARTVNSIVPESVIPKFVTHMK
jgi:DNA-binding transcriptional LysR family regulator